MPDSSSLHLTYSEGLWLGPVFGRFGVLELVLCGTPDAPNPQHVLAIEEFLPQGEDIIQRLHRRLRFSFLWRPVRLAPNNQNRVGVQFQHRILNRRVIHFADEVA